MKVGKIRINMIKDSSYTDKANALANIGESIQTVAMEYILEKIDVGREDIIEIDQCGVKEYDGEPIVFPLRLPLSKSTIDDFFPLKECITPIFMSLHLHDDIFEQREDLVEYFKRYAPIGCRDEVSCGYFRKHGIEAYIMGCYTLCLPKREKVPEAGHPFLVDVSEEMMRYVPDEIKSRAEIVTHAVPFQTYPVTHSEDKRLVETARQYLLKYRENADLVITSRLHAAAPCMAMGISVVLGSNNVDFRYAWIDKYLKIYQESEYGAVDWSGAAPDLTVVKELLLDFYATSIRKKRPAGEILRKLDAYYRARERTQYYKCFRDRLIPLKEIFKQNDSFSYAIWGAGCHASFAKDLMEEVFPNARLQVIFDKYKRGTMFDVPIVSGEDIGKYSIQHVCITTNPGMQEAVKACNEVFGPDAKYVYTPMASQQKS